MLIDRFPFQKSLSLQLKHTKCTLNLRSLCFSSAYSSREENSDQGTQGKFAVFLSFFFKMTIEYFLQLPLSICTFDQCILLTGEEICWICLNFTALAQCFGVHPQANGRCLIDQSEHTFYFCCVINRFHPYSNKSPNWYCVMCYWLKGTWDQQSG